MFYEAQVLTFHVLTFTCESMFRNGNEFWSLDLVTLKLVVKQW